MNKNILNSEIIERKFYIKKIEKFLDSDLIKVLVWQRRVWKSFILRSIIKKLYNEKKILEKNIFYINKEYSQFDHIEKYEDLKKEFENFLLSADQNKKIFIWIDEAQEIKWWEKFVNSKQVEFAGKIEIFVTGSNSNMLSWDLATLLSGRYIEFEIFPLSFEEFCIFKNVKQNKQEFFEYMKYWGLPWIFNLKYDEEIIFSYLKSVYDTIVLKDIISHYNIKNIDFFHKLYKYIFANISFIFSAKSITNYLKNQDIKITVDSVLNFLSYWENTYILNKVSSYNPDNKKFFKIYNKYYTWDLGLRNALVWFNLTNWFWKLLENYVFLVLKRYWYEVKIWRLKWDKEIDFIATKAWITKYFQVAYLLFSEETIEREFSSLEQVHDSWEKYVLSLDDINFWVKNWIKHYNIMDLEKILLLKDSI